MKTNENSHITLEPEFHKNLMKRVCASYSASMTAKNKNPHIETPDNKNSHYYKSLENDIEERLKEEGATISYATLHRFFWNNTYSFKSYTVELLEKYSNLHNEDFPSSQQSSPIFQQEVIQTKTANEGALSEYLATLKYFYNTTYQIKEGCKVSEEALELFPEQIDIVRWWALFHNRKMEWIPVRTTLAIIATKTTDEKVKSECLLAIFESYLNEFIRIRHQNSAEFEKLKEAKGKYLDVIPNKETIGKYYYFLARYFEAEWWVIPKYSGKIASMNILNSAVKLIDKALSLYPKKSDSGYSAAHPVPWWLYCHKAMLYKILEHHKFEESSEEFFAVMKREVEKKDNTLKKSIHIYAATYFLMKEDDIALNTFLRELIIRVTARLEELGLSEDYEDSEVESYSYHHIDMIFWREKDEEIRNKYFSIMNKFQQECPW